MSKREERIVARVTPQEKKKIRALAGRCGLSQTEYLRQRALGFEPKAVQMEVVLNLIQKLDSLAENCFSQEVEKETLTLLSEIERELIEPGRGRA